MSGPGQNTMPTARGPIALDGPAASGKTTTGRLVAQRLRWQFIDTGLMYRAVGYLALRHRVPLSDEAALAQIAEQAHMTIDDASITVDGEEIGPLVHAPEVSQAASRAAEAAPVRAVLVARQRQMAERAGGRVVMVGRDICTVVLPDAPVKVWLDASPEERARRRLNDETRRGHDTDYASVLEELRERDRRDADRAVSPSIPAESATHVPTDGRTIDQVVATILNLATGSADSNT